METINKLFLELSKVVDPLVYTENELKLQKQIDGLNKEIQKLRPLSKLTAPAWTMPVVIDIPEIVLMKCAVQTLDGKKSTGYFRFYKGIWYYVNKARDVCIFPGFVLKYRKHHDNDPDYLNIKKFFARIDYHSSYHGNTN